MLLEGSNTSAAISWVREDLDECLAVVREKLEEFSEQPSQRPLIDSVQEKLEQLNLTFVTMDQRGAVMLTDEMIAVGGNILHNEDVNLDESLSALSDAIVVLPSYLDRLQAGHEDLPILLLPTLNELRASHDESMLSEGTLFAPDLQVIIEELGSDPEDPVSLADWGQFIRRTRTQYQTALLGWLKDQANDKHLDPLRKACETLHSRLHNANLRRLWWIAENVVSGLQEHMIDNDLPLRRMFARLDLCLKAMVEGGQDGPAEDTITALSRALLFHVAQARKGFLPVDRMRELFRIEEIIPDRDALLRAKGAVTGRDAQLFHSIGLAIREEMSSIKDSLDMELRTGHIDSEARAAVVSSLIQLSDTLHMLELPVPASALQGLLPSLELTREVENFELDSPLLALAQQLLEVESVLEKHIQLLGEPFEESEGEGHLGLSGHQHRHILSRMLDEAVTSLHAAEDAIRDRLDKESDADFATPLQEISGAMFVVGQPEVSKLTDKLERAFHAYFKDIGAKQEEHGISLMLLADAVAALELYLAGCRDEQANSLRFLDIMQDRLEGLPEASADGEVVRRTVVRLPQRPSSESPTQEAPKTPAPSPGETEQDDRLPAAIDSSMQDIFLEEFEAVISDLGASSAAWLEDTSQRRPLEDIRRGFHTLKGSGRMVGAKEIGEFCWRIESLLNRVLENKVDTTSTVSRILNLSIGALPELRTRLLQKPSDLTVPAIKQLSEHARQLEQGEDIDLGGLESLLPASVLEFKPESAGAAAEPPASTEVETEVASPDHEAQPSAGEEKQEQQEPGLDPTLVQLMIGEIRQYLDTLEPWVASAESGSPGQSTVDHVRAAHSLAGTLALAPLANEAELAKELESFLKSQANSDRLPAVDDAPVLRGCLQRFSDRLAILEGKTVAASFGEGDESLINGLAELKRNLGAGKPVTAEIPDEAANVATTEAQDVSEPEIASEPEKTEEPGPQDGLDKEILDIFLGESTEVLERCDTILNTWRDKLADEKLIHNLQREIHTFKGGARMAGLEVLGDLSHAMESLLEKIAAGGIPATVAAVQALEEGCDRLNIWVELLHNGGMPEDDGALNRFQGKVSLLISGRAEAAAEPTPVAEEPSEETPEVATEEVVAQAPEQTDEPKTALPDTGADYSDPSQVAGLATSATEIDRLDELPKDFTEIGDMPAPDEDAPAGAQIRVAADLMDSLVNFSGEISIYRARLEEQLSTVRFNLKEVDQTVARLKEQLRKMETETEAQMLSRYHKASSAETSSEFDPLELDRFSNIQQLSRGLSETVSDLLSLHEMLDGSVREAESLLGAQSRVSSDLQDGLMQTRMTPFTSAAPRMRRTVRAAAAEVEKKARLRLMVGGSSDRLDRNVLERIAAPMEHMLRNAVVHGLETPEERRKAGKPEEGVISVTVSAEATEFVIRVQDDGAGLNLDAIRKRAIERGLISKSEDIPPRQLARFILESGFSTTNEVTGLAGRGVGMDVVNSEIKQIGGSVEIATEQGKGSRFTVRIPFSLAVMQVIGISVASQQYNIPLNTVAGVGRMTPADYAKLIRRDSPSCEFAGEEYPLMDLAPLLGLPPDPLDSDNISLLMVDTGEFKAAFRIAELRGHQEVVVKPIGPQISGIPGILGGTIAGDGRVVIILDMGPLIRNGAGRPIAPIEPPVEEPEDLRQPLVMVIDDSITMRKVTTRVLENHSLKVVAAKDGVDAVEKLHDCIPDLILLDIEMPRMDGYELAEHVRSDSRLRGVPIIMVTSRAGQKHRQRARKIGANGYLTKPYQEAELIEQVGELLSRDLTRKAD